MADTGVASSCGAFVAGGGWTLAACTPDGTFVVTEDVSVTVDSEVGVALRTRDATLETRPATPPVTAVASPRGDAPKSSGVKSGSASIP